MPDDIREPFRPKVRIDPPREPERGFTANNTSGLTAAELASLNEALGRLTAAGLSDWDAKRALDTAVREGMEPGGANKVEVGRLLGRA